MSATVISSPSFCPITRRALALMDAGQLTTTAAVAVDQRYDFLLTDDDVRRAAQTGQVDEYVYHRSHGHDARDWTSDMDELERRQLWPAVLEKEWGSISVDQLRLWAPRLPDAAWRVVAAKLWQGQVEVTDEDVVADFLLDHVAHLRRSGCFDLVLRTASTTFARKFVASSHLRRDDWASLVLREPGPAPAGPLDWTDVAPRASELTDAELILFLKYADEDFLSRIPALFYRTRLAALLLAESQRLPRDLVGLVVDFCAPEDDFKVWERDPATGIGRVTRVAP